MDCIQTYIRSHTILDSFDSEAWRNILRQRDIQFQHTRGIILRIVFDQR